MHRTLLIVAILVLAAGLVAVVLSSQTSDGDHLASDNGEDAVGAHDEAASGNGPSDTGHDDHVSADDIDTQRGATSGSEGGAGDAPGGTAEGQSGEESSSPDPDTLGLDEDVDPALAAACGQLRVDQFHEAMAGTTLGRAAELIAEYEDAGCVPVCGPTHLTPPDRCLGP